MRNRAQSGMEYLMTYGWALIMIATIFGVIVFLIGSPIPDVTFTISDPAKMGLKASNTYDSTAQAILENLTGGKVQFESIDRSESDFSNCAVNGKNAGQLSISPEIVGAGGEILLECTGTASGKVTLGYKDFAGFSRTVDVISSEAWSGNPPLGECTDGQQQNCPLQLGVCSGAQETCTGQEWPGCSTATYFANNPAYEETESTCDDAYDNDCDGATNCDDAHCSEEPVCLIECNTLCNGVCPGVVCFGTDPDCDSGGGATLACCGNDVCDGSETTYTCEIDCPACDTDCDGDCPSSSCFGIDPDCDSGGGATLACCGNNVCDAGETTYTCEIDCPCDTVCDGDCPSSSCFGIDPDCDSGGGATLACCGNNVCDAGETTYTCEIDCPGGN